MLLSPLKIPPTMITEIALGVELGVDIAFRYGLDTQDFRDLEQQDWFRRKVENERAELKAAGLTFRKKMAMRAEELLDQVFQQAYASQDMALKLDIAKYLTKIADLEPKTNAPPNIGSGFNITINMGEPKAPSYANATVRAYEQEIIEVEAESLPPAPIFLARIPFESLSAYGQRGL